MVASSARRQSPELLRSLLTQLLGTRVVDVRESYADEMRVDFAMPDGVATRSQQLWTLGTRASAWAARTRAGASSTDVAGADRALKDAVVTDVSVSAALALDLLFEGGSRLTVEPDLTERELSAWEVMTPFDFAVIAGPGAAWEIVDADSPFEPPAPAPPPDAPASAAAAFDALMPILADRASPEVLHGAGQAFAAELAYEHALVLYRRALESAPFDRDLVLDYATALRQAGHLEEHAAELARASESLGDSARLLAFVAVLDAQRHEIERSIRMIRRALELAVPPPDRSGDSLARLRRDVGALAEDTRRVAAEVMRSLRAHLDDLLRVRPRR